MLSWPAFDGAVPAPGGEPLFLGDLALGYETCAREAGAAGIALADHAAHLVVHGVLHLLGHDHADDAEAEAMEALETNVLASMGMREPIFAARGAPRARHPDRSDGRDYPTGMRRRAAGPSDDDDPDSPADVLLLPPLPPRRRRGRGADATPDAAERRAARGARELLVNLRNLRRMRVDDVSVPRADIVAVPEHASLDEVVEVFKASTLSRLPVYSRDARPAARARAPEGPGAESTASGRPAESST